MAFKKVYFSKIKKRNFLAESELPLLYNILTGFGLVMLVRHAAGTLVACCWHIAGTLPARCWHAVGTLLARCWHAGSTLLARCWHVAGTMLARCWHAAGTPLALSWHAAGTLVMSMRVMMLVMDTACLVACAFDACSTNLILPIRTFARMCSRDT